MGHVHEGTMRLFRASSKHATATAGGDDPVRRRPGVIGRLVGRALQSRAGRSVPPRGKRFGSLERVARLAAGWEGT